ncbi:PAS domain-containing protein [Thiocapsa sp.]|uniref:PAS domain-containing protein n=1 Tax=Thiocapsa sp. TaxID=2024551 RepID=UPI003594871A
MQTLPDLVWLKDPNGVYLTCNARFEAFFGAPQTAIVGRTDCDFFAHQEADLFHAFDLRAMETGTASVNTATPAAIGSWPRSHRNCGRNCVRATPWRASAATRSRS